MAVVVAILALLASATAALAQAPDAEAVEAALIEKGFENVGARLEGRRLIVTYENRIYRYEARGLQEAVKTVLPLARETDRVVFVVRNRDVPTAQIEVPTRAYDAFAAGETSLDTFLESWTVGEPEAAASGARRSRSLRKLDLSVAPGLVTQLGSYQSTFRSEISLVPTLSTSLWPGMTLSGSWLLPLWHNIEGFGLDRYGEPRPGVIALNQTLRLPANLLLSATAGHFTGERYGLDGELFRFVANGYGALSARAGWTGFVRYADRTWNYRNPSQTTATATALLFVPRYLVTVSVTAGRFLYDDRGLSAAVQRSFGEIDVTFFVQATEAGENGGVSVRLPLPTARHPRPGRIRVRPASSFTHSYRYLGLQTAPYYGTGSSAAGFFEDLIPLHVKSRLSLLNNWR